MFLGGLEDERHVQGQILTTTDALALSLVGACQREIGRAKLVGDLSMP